MPKRKPYLNAKFLHLWMPEAFWEQIEDARLVAQKKAGIEISRSAFVRALISVGLQSHEV